MKTTKKMLSIILALIMAVTCVIPVFADTYATSGTCGENVTWEFDVATRTLTISGEGGMDDFDYDDGGPWSTYKEIIKTVVIEEGVTSIGRYAFGDHSALTNVYISNTVSYIDNAAFSECISIQNVYISDLSNWCNMYYRRSNSNPLCYGGNLYLNEELVTDLVIPDNVSSISENAFYGCNSITSVTFNDNLTSIGEYAFENCDNIASVTFNDNLTSIGEYAFAHCDNIASVAFNENLSSIGEHAFAYCDNIASVAFNDNLTSINKYVFYNCDGLTSVAFTDCLTSIDEFAFSHCSNLAEVSIGKNVSSIAETAFIYCGSLTKINVDEDNETFKSIDGVLFSSNMVALLQYPAQKTDEAYTIPDNVLIIKDYAFQHNDYLKTVTIPETVATIGEYTFFDCDALTSITIPDEVVSIGDYAFCYCDKLETVIMGNGITSIGEFAFYRDGNLDGYFEETDLYYNGTEEQWNDVSVGYYNHFARIHYNCTSPEGHYTLTKVVAPTSCSEQGYSEYTCPCGYTMQTDYTTVDHTSGEWIVSREATCTSDGYRYKRCTYCGTRLNEETIPSTDHTASEWQSVAPTCTEAGLEGKCCTSCGELLEGEIVAALGGSHSFGEWTNIDNKQERTCSTCGYIEYRIVPGDLNGDGYTSAKEARIILQHVAGLREIEENSEYADVNEDGRISAVDARMVLQMVAGLKAPADENWNIISYNTSNIDPDAPVVSSLTITSNKSEVAVGDVFTVTVALDDNSGLGGLTIKADYDSSVLKATAMTAGTLGATVNVETGIATMASATTFEDAGTICVMTFEAIKTGSADVTFDIIEACDSDLSDVNLNVNTVNIDVVEELTTEPDFPEGPCADGHTWTEWIVIDEPACNSYGLEEISCTECGYSEYRSIDPTGHSYTWYTLSVAACETDGVMIGECSLCEDVDLTAIPKTGHNIIDGACTICGKSEDNITEPEVPDEPEEYDFTFSIQTPSTNTIRHLDGIVLHAKVDGTLPEGAYIKWTADNDNFDIESTSDGMTATITSKNYGDTTIYAIVYNADGEIIASESVKMTSKAGFFDKFGSFFRSIFGTTKIYEN